MLNPYFFKNYKYPAFQILTISRSHVLVLNAYFFKDEMHQPRRPYQ